MLTRVIDPCQYVVVKTIATLAASARRCSQGRSTPRGRRAPRQALKVLADPARLRLLSLIQAQPAHEACVCHLTEPLGLTQPTVSHHLKVLLRPGWSSASSAAAGPTSASGRNRSRDLRALLGLSGRGFRTTRAPSGNGTRYARAPERRNETTARSSRTQGNRVFHVFRCSRRWKSPVADRRQAALGHPCEDVLPVEELVTVGHDERRIALVPPAAGAASVLARRVRMSRDDRGAGASRLGDRGSDPELDGHECPQADCERVRGPSHVRVIVGQLESRHHEHPVLVERARAASLSRSSRYTRQLWTPTQRLPPSLGRVWSVTQSTSKACVP